VNEMEKLIDDIKKMRRRFEQSESGFFLFLHEVETTRSKEWSIAGCETFKQFLMSHDIVNFNRYALFCHGLSRTSAKLAMDNGVHWVIAVGQLRPDIAADVTIKLIKLADGFREVHCTAPSEQTVKKWISESVPRDVDKNANVRAATELRRLREENRVLKIEVEQLRRENSDLRAKLESKRGGNQPRA
jgi:hypothetical protein